MHYRRLYLGEIEAVTLFISPADTNTNTPDQPLGLYRMSADDFRSICDALAKGDEQTGEIVAQRADSSGVGSRWFRLSEPFAEWLEKQTPIMAADDYIV